MTTGISAVDAIVISNKWHDEELDKDGKQIIDHSEFHGHSDYKLHKKSAHQEAAKIVELFKDLVPRVRHLKDPSKQEINSVFTKFENDESTSSHSKAQPLLFCFVGEGFEINGKLHCKSKNADTGKSVFVPIENRLENYIECQKCHTTPIISFFNCTRRVVTEKELQSKKLGIRVVSARQPKLCKEHRNKQSEEPVFQRDNTFIYAQNGDTNRSLNSTREFIEHLPNQMRPCAEVEGFKELILPYGIVGLHGKGSINV